MGLTVSHGSWNGAYSAFNRWRTYIAEVAGYCVWDVRDDEGPMREVIILEWHQITNKNLFGVWEKPPHDPLHVLFVHSDCEGKIIPEQAKPLADALEQLLPKMKVNTPEAGGHIAANGGYYRVTEKFINGLRLAVSENEDVEFM